MNVIRNRLMTLAVGMMLSGYSIADVPLTAMSPEMQTRALQDVDPKVAANKKLVYDFIREVLVAGHLDLVDRYLAEGYVQHSLGVPTGRRGLVEHLRRRHVFPLPIEATIENPPLFAIIGSGDQVVTGFIRSRTEHGNTYSYSHFDMFRIRNGLIVEHWDSNMFFPSPEHGMNR